MKTRNRLYDKSRLRLLCLLTALLGLFGAGHALAGNPTTLTVGGTDVLNGGYWTTNADGTLTPDGASADNYNVYYDGNGTLTLKDATINGTSCWRAPAPSRAFRIQTANPRASVCLGT